MHVDYLIIGQGISGTWLSYYLQKENKSFLVIDNNSLNSPSRIAAGIINPVTGRRMVSVWLVDKILPFSLNTYHEIGEELGITTISHKNIIDFFPTLQMRKVFVDRIEEGYEYVHPFPGQNEFNDFFNYDFGCGEIKPVYIAHLEVLLPAWRNWLQEKELLLEENFEAADLKIIAGNIHYKGIIADKIIFCDGNASFENPYFSLLPFAPNKGEAFIVEIPGLSKKNIYKKGITLAPLIDKDLFWVGSNYLWEFDSADPSKEFRQRTEQTLKEWLKVPFKIISHQSAIRPATIERRPFVGIHPHHPQIGVLNGMGTKGCSLAPYFAKQFVDHLVHKKEILPEADIKRFSRILQRVS